MSLLLAGMVASCDDTLPLPEGGTSQNGEEGIGQLVLFTAGNVRATETRADVIPYMEKDGRFVCKMYYHAKATDTEASPFELNRTPITSWLRVKDDYGNSVYWNNQYEPLSSQAMQHIDYMTYGFDPDAQYFYWRNRLSHVFLGFTDYHQLKTNRYKSIIDEDFIDENNVANGSLFMYPQYDGVKRTHVKDSTTWDPAGYMLLKIKRETLSNQPNPEYSEADHQQAVKKGETYDVPPYIDVELYAYDSHDVVTELPPYTAEALPPDSYTVAVDSLKAAINRAPSLSSSAKQALIQNLERTEWKEENEGSDTYRYSTWIISYNPDENIDGQVNLAAANTVIRCMRQKKRIIPIYEETEANSFDLTRKAGMENITYQPDPLLACTKMIPAGATQEANRVRLYFKHQFSQIQVNLTNAASNTSDIQAENIVSVELLGVSKKGYVFTTIKPDGTPMDPAYDPIVITEYTKDQLAKNPYGSSFSMFDMGDDKPITSIKSYNAIAFGELKAIRITWKEDKDDTDVGVHQATYKVAPVVVGGEEVDLNVLQSGKRYIYDFELRRGTIAFIRAEIVGWKLDDALNYNTSGTVKD